MSKHMDERIKSLMERFEELERGRVNSSFDTICIQEEKRLVENDYFLNTMNDINSTLKNKFECSFEICI